MNAILTKDASVLILMSGETRFYLDGYVNIQNGRYWASENPHQLHQKPIHSSKVTVWYGVSKIQIVGPYLFEEGEPQLPTSRTKRFTQRHSEDRIKRESRGKIERKYREKSKKKGEKHLIYWHTQVKTWHGTRRAQMLEQS